MAANPQAVRDYVKAATSDRDDALTAVRAALADDVAFHSPLGDGSGRDAVLGALSAVRPVFLTGAWADPVTDGDTVKVSATFPPGSVLGTAELTFTFDADGKITDLQQQLTAGAPPPPTPIALDGELAPLINGALDNGTPIIAAYVDGEGQAQLSFRGTTQVFSPDQLAVWARDPAGGMVRALPENARLTFFYVDRPARVNLQIQGLGHVESDPQTRDLVFDHSPPRERATDPDRRGVAIVVDVHSVSGRGPSGPVNMRRGA